MEVNAGLDESRPFPAELMGRIPRRVRLTGTGWCYALVSAALFLLAMYFTAKITRAEESSTSPAWWMLLFPAFFVLMSYLFVYRFPLQRRVGIYGVPAWACIDTPPPMGPSKGPQWESYTFRNQANEVQYGRCLMDVQLKRGTTVCVLYLPKNPIVSHIYPLDYFEAE